ncbi:nuclear transport factor 2 family protein [Kitasatospora sp. NPDC127059]|uniref:nuclear transport factor 2 family protein n=1 Tax=unclassified Kitasatospora TaxID=2633591 RepID=UPI00364984AF
MNHTLSGPATTEFELPRSELAVAALRFAEETEEPFLFRHSVRGYLFARGLAERRGLRADADYHDERLFLGCVLHDLGLTEEGNGDQRFEVDGADLAATFLREHGADEDTVAVVWDAVALHTSDGIAARKGPEVGLAQAGIALDVMGRGRDALPDGFAERVHDAFPREDLGYAIADAIIAQALANPAKASPLSFPGQLLRRRLPHGALPDWHDLIAQAGWGDRPTTTHPTAPAATTPDQLAALFQTHLEAGDLPALASLHEPHAALTTATGTPVTGTDAITDHLRTFLERGARVTLHPRTTHTAGDIAVISTTATVTGTTPDGGALTTESTQVARRQPDGRWLYVIDTPLPAV